MGDVLRGDRTSVVIVLDTPRPNGQNDRRQVSWLSGLRVGTAFPEYFQWHKVVRRSPMTVAGAAPDSRLSPATGFPFDPENGNRRRPRF